MFFGVFTFAQSAFAVQSSASINVAVNTNLLTIDIDSVSVLAGADVFIASGAESVIQSNTGSVVIGIGVPVFTNLLQTQTGNVVTNADANVNLSTNLIQTALGNEVITANANVNLSTNLIQTAINSVTVIGEANVNLSTNLIQTALGNETISGDANVNLSTNLIQSNSGSVVIGIGVPVTGVSMQMSTKTPVVVAWAVVDINVTNTWTTVSTNTTNTWSVVDIAA